jgi:hypothetical protein
MQLALFEIQSIILLRKSEPIPDDQDRYDVSPSTSRLMVLSKLPINWQFEGGYTFP